MEEKGKITSHNSWTFLPVKQWYLKPLSFMARCQSKDIEGQLSLGIRSFDLRIRFDKDDRLIIAHGMFEYSGEYLWDDLERLNQFGCTLRIIHEVRNKASWTKRSLERFREVCQEIHVYFPQIKLWGGTNLYNGEVDYDFKYYPSCEGKYSSASNPKYIDDWFPWMYARIMNKRNLKKGTDKDLLMIDFVEIRW